MSTTPVVEWGGMELPLSWGHFDPNSEAVPFDDPNSEAVPFRLGGSSIPPHSITGVVEHGSSSMDHGAGIMLIRGRVQL